MTPRHLIALDIDGTVLTETGELFPAIVDEVARLAAAGHEVMLATGRGVSMTLPVLDRLGIAPEYVVSANGAITLRREPDAPLGYVRHHIETFDPTEALLGIRPYLAEAQYMVENEQGEQLFLGDVPGAALDASSRRVEFEQMLHIRATRVVVVSPEHTSQDFLELVERMGLDSVAYNVGWAAWLDLAPEGVTKATALERVRAELGIDPARVVAVGDGRNDIEMLRWAGASGRGVAMGQAPDEVRAAATEVAGTDAEGGLAAVLASVG
ncbi:HAD hydrolase family protein [Galbitalea sp. SE-J8]|uniref:HAD family hydrolase n=1 Tax=Galbitalea sp. SE-J8 TaxID=3054952 RepID=UPI00259CFCBA|nr:HAD hydrolase family protein [Galbitalea sp. SE-J8]MDM4763889.1 HAD hydrolase family protein [Galbitalea sp. SE-J8]